MLPSSFKRSVLSISILLLTFATCFSQSTEQTDYRRLSLSLSAGANLGDMNTGNYFMSSNFSVNTKNTPTFGIGVQYALTPDWSFEVGYRHAQIKGVTKPFETTMHFFTLKNVINLNQLFSLNQTYSRINPFLTFGLGYDSGKYQGADEKFKIHNTSYNAGAGIAYRLSNTVDLFSHYEYHLGSNHSDNENEGLGTDLINSLTAGVRINFGKKESRLLSWREAPVDLSRSDYDLFSKRLSRLDDLEQTLVLMENRLTEKEQLIEKLEQEKSTEIDSLQAQLDRLKNDFAKLEIDVKDVKTDKETGFAGSLPQGNYVQIFASNHYDNANFVRQDALSNLHDVLKNTEEKVFIIHRKQFYEVLIGMFENIDHARQVRDIMKQVHHDAYVIHFPRAINLRSDFAGLEVVDSKSLELSAFNN
ncbi:outer membrane beta-barrel protein [Aliifodinibius sp. S!AR15-10]|uniref:outer membrane beta-barrel protein n=1 Tax=Aliifodinibius sp. S!AR15-10 TaxID=2950437 RepID=UPI0028548533|nr:outer membrane beta-barrel protein [Aliifodinibius sp. S!AR15-10]MDR8391994.1 outer membrane beta-barrel protein [Aliifodinibius sp. S!AR15-10]